MQQESLLHGIWLASVEYSCEPLTPSQPAQVGTTMRTSQGKFKLLGLQGPLEGFFLSEAQHSLQRFNALLALLIHERGLSQPTNLVRAASTAQTPCQLGMLKLRGEVPPDAMRQGLSRRPLGHVRACMASPQLVTRMCLELELGLCPGLPLSRDHCLLCADLALGAAAGRSPPRSCWARTMRT